MATTGAWATRQRISGVYAGALLAMGLAAWPGAGWGQAVVPVDANAVPPAAAPVAVPERVQDLVLVVDAAKMKALGVTQKDIDAALAQAGATKPEGWGDIVVRTANGQQVRLRDVARVEQRGAGGAVVPVGIDPNKTTPVAVPPPKAGDPNQTVTTGGTPMPRSTPVAATKAFVPPPPLATTVPASTLPAAKEDGAGYAVTGLVLEYAAEHKGRPSLSELAGAPVTLGVVADGLVAPRAGLPTVTLRVSEVGKVGPKRLYGSAFRPVYEALTKELNRRGLLGVFVVASTKDIDSRDRDLRAAGQTELHVTLYTSVVKTVRTVALGKDVAADQRIDSKRLARLVERSPVKPGGNDLLQKDQLDDYVMRLNRHPGRRVDVAISGTDAPGEVNVDYLVSESRPWYAFVQLSNSGTAQTADWRERFGFVHNQLTGHDDILSLDYVTAGFDASNAVVASYEVPVFNLDRLRARGYAGWSEYTASDVGQAQQEFTGNSWDVGAELLWNFYQRRELFVDLVSGLRYQQGTVTDETFSNTGDVGYWVPYAGVRMNRSTDLYSLFGEAMLIGALTNASQEELDNMGRSNPDGDAAALQMSLNCSFFLEPLLFPNDFAQGKGTLAHELYFAGRGQYGFNYRLVPQFEQTVGGLYSVRGYTESAEAGDSTYVLNFEYRYHLPRSLKVQPDPNKTKLLGTPFKVSPVSVYGRPDWDLIGRAFVDVGQTFNNKKEAFEQNATLVSSGIGLELQIKQYFDIRLDWGVVLNEITDVASVGDNRLGIVITLAY